MPEATADKYVFTSYNYAETCKAFLKNDFSCSKRGGKNCGYKHIDLRTYDINNDTELKVVKTKFVEYNYLKVFEFTQGAPKWCYDDSILKIMFT